IWTLTLTPSTGSPVTSTITLTGTTHLSNILTQFKNDINAATNWAATLQGNTITIANDTAGLTFSAQLEIDSRSSVTTVASTALTFANAVRANDVWTVTLNGTPVPYTATVSDRNSMDSL